MLDSKALSKAVCRIVVAVTGLPADKVILADNNTAAPSGSYCAGPVEVDAEPEREPVKTILRAAKLGWSRVSPINNLTGLYQAAMEERSQLTLYLYGESIAEDRVQRIYRAGFSVQTEQSGAVAQGEVNGLSG